ncbi:MAG: hypothetical protein ATN35_06065 [Epulopiscium sp. Nele67-Bin004]|nr:MAG: hypothetical protein ATN35_06065 [Epulopiscium sp. Nele67-Bin004]
MRLGKEFFARHCITVAQQLIGKKIVHKLVTGEIISLRISETEAYCGGCDTAAHAYPHKRTKRTEPLFWEAGTIYIYLCYGIHWLLNVSTDEVDNPRGVLIRACVGYEGPAKLTKQLQITNNDLNFENVATSEFLWFEDDGTTCQVITDKRVGIGYAKIEDQERQWRFKLVKKL